MTNNETYNIFCGENKEINFDSLVHLLEQTHNELQKQAAKSIDISLVIRNWLFGWYIEEFEKGSTNRSGLYGKKLLLKLSEELTKRLGKGFSRRSLDQFRQFYVCYKEIWRTVSAKSSFCADDKNKYAQVVKHDSIELEKILYKLSEQFKLGWSHYVRLLSIRNKKERKFYEIETINNNWSVRELERQIASSLYERLALSRNDEKVRELSEIGQLVSSPEDIIKNPYILEFLNLAEHPHYTEHELEIAIINKIEHFLLELGKGFLFEARQKRFTFDDDHFYVDLVFYNRLLRSYVLIDLKRDKLTHQDLGQMQMYVNYFDRFIKKEYEAPTIGILLCHRKNDALVELTLPKEANIHASEYQLYLPSKDELKRQLEEVQKDRESENEL